MMDALTRGEWKPGDAIPAERRLSERYGISIGTVRKAIDELVAENILIRQQGRGTFVATHNRDRMMFYFFHIVADRGQRRNIPRSNSSRSPAARQIAPSRTQLELVAGDARLSHPQPAASRRERPHRRRHHAPRRPLRGPDREAVPHRVRRRSTTSTRRRSGSRSYAPANAFGPTWPMPRPRALLDLAPGAPLLSIRRVALGYNDVPVEYRVSQVDTARFEYWNEIKG